MVCRCRRGVVLGVLATIYGYLKMGLPAGESRGGRVQLAAGVVAMIVAAGALGERFEPCRAQRVMVRCSETSAGG